MLGFRTTTDRCLDALHLPMRHLGLVPGTTQAAFCKDGGGSLSLRHGEPGTGPGVTVKEPYARSSLSNSYAPADLKTAHAR